MSTTGNSGYSVNIESILKEAKARWLKGFEVLCILQNFQVYGLQLSATPPLSPPTGSLYLFNKRLVKFRKDGVNWKKQKDGKTVRESHEKLKVGGIKVLSCCYTRSAENPNFQRRIYWLLDGDSNIVLVHYLEGNLSEKAEGSFSNAQNNEERGMISNTSPDSENIKGESLSSEEEEMNLHSIGTPSSSRLLMDESLMDFVNSFAHSDDLAKLHPPPALNTRAPNFPPLNPTPNTGRLAKVLDFSPSWDYLEGGNKILITGPEIRGAGPFFVLFDQVEVPAEIVFDGVLRSRIPPHFAAGFVSLCVTRGNFVLFSEVKHFEYRKALSEGTTSTSYEETCRIRIFARLERMERDIHLRKSSPFNPSESMMHNLAQAIEKRELGNDQIEPAITRILQTFIKEIDGDVSSIDARDKDGFTMLHSACSLGYYLFATTLIFFKANPNLQDAHGETPFHTAMKRRDQKMIKILLDHVELPQDAFSAPNTLSRSVKTEETSSRHEVLESITDSLDGLEIQANADDAATTIQSLFRGWKAREEIYEENSAAAKIQKAWRDHYKPQQFDEDYGQEEEEGYEEVEEESFQSAPLEFFSFAPKDRKLALNKRIEQEAAKKIQSAFKAYRERRLKSAESSKLRRTHDARFSKVSQKRK